MRLLTPTLFLLLVSGWVAAGCMAAPPPKKASKPSPKAPAPQAEPEWTVFMAEIDNAPPTIHELIRRRQQRTEIGALFDQKRFASWWVDKKLWILVVFHGPVSWEQIEKADDTDHPSDPNVPRLENPHFYRDVKPRSWVEAYTDGRLKKAIAFSDAKLLECGLKRGFLEQARILQTDGRPDLTYVRLVDEKMAGIDLSRADLTNADLSGSDLTRAQLGGTRLIGATFRSAQLVSASFIGCDATRADFSDATFCDPSDSQRRATFGNQPSLEGANFTGAFMANILLSQADLRRAVLSRANLRSARLTICDLSEADLSGANLSGASLIQVKLNDADLSGADLRGALLSCDLSGATLDGARYNSRTRWPNGFNPLKENLVLVR